MISKLIKNDGVTLLNTDKGNDVINACNRSESWIVSPASAGSVEVTDTNMILKLTGAGGSGIGTLRIIALISGVYKEVDFNASVFADV